ncbi:MAG: 50S ribosomal protein L19 [Patescibacteria group bacterium]
MHSVITPVKTEERSKLGIRPGDTVRVHQKIVEKGKTRIQNFEGLVLAVKHGTEAGATFTVRATMSGIGVERIFPLYAPFIEKIEITRRSKVRRAKLYFIREKVAREVRRQLRNMRLVKISTDDFKEAEIVEAPEVSVEDVQAVDPAQNPDGTDMTPAEEVAGAPEASVVDEPAPAAPAPEEVPTEEKEG